MEIMEVGPKLTEALVDAFLAVSPKQPLPELGRIWALDIAVLFNGAAAVYRYQVAVSLYDYSLTSRRLSSTTVWGGRAF